MTWSHDGKELPILKSPKGYYWYMPTKGRNLHLVKSDDAGMSCLDTPDKKYTHAECGYAPAEYPGWQNINPYKLKWCPKCRKIAAQRVVDEQLSGQLHTSRKRSIMAKRKPSTSEQYEAALMSQHGNPPAPFNPLFDPKAAGRSNAVTASMSADRFYNDHTREECKAEWGRRYDALKAEGK